MAVELLPGADGQRTQPSPSGKRVIYMRTQVLKAAYRTELLPAMFPLGWAGRLLGPTAGWELEATKTRGHKSCGGSKSELEAKKTLNYLVLLRVEVGFWVHMRSKDVSVAALIRSENNFGRVVVTQCWRMRLVDLKRDKMWKWWPLQHLPALKTFSTVAHFFYLDPYLWPTARAFNRTL